MSFLTKALNECPRCKHPQTSAVHGFSVSGITQCVMCPDNICTPIEERQVDPMMTIAGNGIAIIGEMSREDLIEEILLAQRGNLMSCELDQLRRFVVQLRIHAYSRRLNTEAGVGDSYRGPFEW